MRKSFFFSYFSFSKYFWRINHNLNKNKKSLARKSNGRMSKILIYLFDMYSILTFIPGLTFVSFTTSRCVETP